MGKYSSAQPVAFCFALTFSLHVPSSIFAKLNSAHSSHLLQAVGATARNETSPSQKGKLSNAMRSFLQYLLLSTLVIMHNAAAAKGTPQFRVGRRRLKGLVFEGAPGTYIGDPNDAVGGHTTTHGLEVGHFTEGGEIVWDEEATKAIAEEIQEIATGSTIRNNKEPSEGEDVVAILVGCILGSFAAVALFLAVGYHVLQHRIEPFMRDESVTESSTGFGDSGRIDCILATSDHSSNEETMCTEKDCSEPENLNESSEKYWTDGPNPRLTFVGDKTLILV